MNEFEMVKLGSLLHDVGKIIQRDMGKKEGSHSELGYKFLKGWGEEIARFAKFHTKKEMVCQESDFEKLSIAQKNLLVMVCEADNLSSKSGEGEGEFIPEKPLISIFSRIKGIRKGNGEHKVNERAYPLKTLDFFRKRRYKNGTYRPQS